ncbi:tyrosine-type recombinase/integrase [Pseudomonas viridiflava]|uniref:tyrosine-type recombinase/integrase n=1 Tax=Pseudomonas viridiflava TaxID=33069 RepID=UPI000F0329C9|nr:tyrosine-type recombinase/integrase [Pseudomonas viridiflava]
MNNALAIKELFDIFQWEQIPAEVTTAEGYALHTTGADWYFPTTLRSEISRFSNIKNESARLSLQLYCVDRARTISSHAGQVMFMDVWYVILKRPEAEKALSDDFKEGLIGLFQSALKSTREDRQLWRMYRPIRWYIWCSENYPEIGFCEAFALELDSISIPGNPKGESVRSEHIDKGPLSRGLELQQLINAMAHSTDSSLKQLQERAALALFIAHGRNPANLTQLLETDLVNLTPNSSVPTWVLNYPRIKKRLKHPRDDMKQVPIPTEYAEYLQAMIAAGRSIECSVMVGGELVLLPRPMFINEKTNLLAQKSGRLDQFYNYASFGITELLRSFVRRHEIISPLTQRLLIISARRLRYTLATNLVLDGVSRRELAEILDHSDLQHVQVYFELASGIVEHLDKALLGFYARFLKYFRGRVVREGEAIINAGDASKIIPCMDVGEEVGVCGQNDLCRLYPPYSCYKCPKFQAYAEADHESVFEFLFSKREKAISAGHSRIAVQLDEILYAVKQVVTLCEESKVA